MSSRHSGWPRRGASSPVAIGVPDGIEWPFTEPNVEIVFVPGGASCFAREWNCQQSSFLSPQIIPHSEKFSSKFLYDFIGNDSWKMFQLLGIDHTFLNIPVTKWKDSSTYLNGKEILSNLPVVNDAAERALGIATEKNTKTAPKSDCQRQALYKVVKGIRERLGKLATSTEVVTKKSLNSIDYSWKEKNDI